MKTLWKKLLLMIIERFINWTCSSPQLYGALKWDSAHSSAVRLTLTTLTSSLLSAQGSWFLSEEALHTTCSALNSRQTVWEQLVNTAQHLAAEEPETSLRSWYRDLRQRMIDDLDLIWFSSVGMSDNVAHMSIKPGMLQSSGGWRWTELVPKSTH